MLRLRWGILGTGKIARKFADQLRRSNTGELAAVGSRSLANAAAFADEFGGRACASYHDLLHESAVEAVYISLPNSLHAEWSIEAMRAGKHVLCEKPIAANAAEAETMLEVAATTERVLVEAFMYRHHPAVKKMISLVHDGAIGKPKLIRTHFTFNRPADAADVRYRPDLAGGALMDIGCYCINFARAIVGREPSELHAVGHLHPAGVDDYAAGLMSFGGDVLCSFTCGMTVTADRTTFVGGSDGYLAIDTPWFSDGRIVLVQGDGPSQVLDCGSVADQYALEADAVAGMIRDGNAPVVSHADSIGNMRVLDELRAQIGLPY